MGKIGGSVYEQNWSYFLSTLALHKNLYNEHNLLISFLTGSKVYKKAI